MKNKKREFLFLALFYLLLILDNSIIYISEFSENFYLLYETSSIFYILVDMIYLGTVIIARQIIAEHFNDKFTKLEKQVCVGLPLILIILSIFAPYEVSEIATYSSLFLAFIYLAWRVQKHLLSHQDDFSESTLKKLKIIIGTIITLNLFGIIESGIYYINTSNSTSTILNALEYRFISLDILKFVICIIGIRHLYNSFEQLFNQRSIGDNLEAFCVKHALTTRQREIIELIIDGYSNKEIGDQLHITEGTVKTHVYNIFKKTDVSSRNQILHKIMHD